MKKFFTALSFFVLCALCVGLVGAFSVPTAHADITPVLSGGAFWPIDQIQLQMNTVPQGVIQLFGTGLDPTAGLSITASPTNTVEFIPIGSTPGGTLTAKADYFPAPHSIQFHPPALSVGRYSVAVMNGSGVESNRVLYVVEPSLTTVSQPVILGMTMSTTTFSTIDATNLGPNASDNVLELVPASGGTTIDLRGVLGGTLHGPWDGNAYNGLDPNSRPVGYFEVNIPQSLPFGNYLATVINTAANISSVSVPVISGGTGSGGGSGGGNIGGNTQTNGSVTLTNLTGPSANLFTVGDNWKLTLSAPQYPNTTIWLYGGQNGNYTNTNAVGKTDASGNFMLTGTMQTSDIGNWAEVWKVGVTSATAVTEGTIGFTVQAAASTGCVTGCGVTLPGQPIGLKTTIPGDGTAATTQRQLIDAMNNLESTYLQQYQTNSSIQAQTQSQILSTLTIPTTPQTVNGVAILTADLKMGDTGSQVTLLTQVLVSDGEMTATQNIFDQTVFDSVVAYQEKYASYILTPAGLTAGTGYVGARTRAYMNGQLLGTNSTGSGSGSAGNGGIPQLTGSSFTINASGKEIVTLTGINFNPVAGKNQINIGSQSVLAS